MPIIAATIGTLLSVVLGMVLSGVRGIERHLAELNGKVFNHITNQSIHEASFARVNEQISNLTTVTKLAHERVDHLKAGVVEHIKEASPGA